MPVSSALDSMKTSIALLVGALLLSGCTHCQVATFYKPSTYGDSRLRTESVMPTDVGIMLGNVPLSIGVCGNRYLAPPGDTVMLCISLELDEATTFRFAESMVSLEAGLSAPKAVSMTSVEYEIFCQVVEGKRRCTSNEESPVVGAVNAVNKVSSVGTVDRYAFDPALEFRGAMDMLHEGAWFGHRLTGKRRYYVRTVSTPILRGAELSVQLPEVIINGNAFTPPKLNFRVVTEEVCRMVPLA